MQGSSLVNRSFGEQNSLITKTVYNSAVFVGFLQYEQKSREADSFQLPAVLCTTATWFLSDLNLCRNPTILHITRPTHFYYHTQPYVSRAQGASKQLAGCFPTVFLKSLFHCGNDLLLQGLFSTLCPTHTVRHHHTCPGAWASSTTAYMLATRKLCCTNWWLSALSKGHFSSSCWGRTSLLIHSHCLPHFPTMRFLLNFKLKAWFTDWQAPTYTVSTPK